MNLTFNKCDIHQSTDDCTAVFVYQDRSTFSRQVKAIQLKLRTTIPAVDTGDFKGKDGQSTVLYVKRSASLRRYILIGLGEQQRLSAERIRRAAAIAARKARSLHASSLSLMVPVPSQRFGEAVAALAEGAYLSLYRFDKYLTKEKDSPSGVETLTICEPRGANARQGKRIVDRTKILCEATVLARDLGNAPGNEIYPETLADAARASSRRGAYDASVLDEHEIKNLGMGGVLGVSQGSAHPPRFIILEYGNPGRRPVVLVGKGVTFDSGGISIKPSAGMAEMKMDMSGAAAVIGTFEAVSRLKLPVHIIGLIPAVENMPSGSSIRPGDILRHYNGKTSEVDNTDAEGRLILADALAYAEQYKPTAVIDLATLTGAVVVALGHHATGMMGNDRELMRQLRQAGEATYERLWELPLFDEYEKLVKSDIADVKNVGGRWAGAITGAMFLKKFVGSYKWAHLDIAGTAILEEPGSYTTRGASGVGVRLLTEFLRRWK
ncbi:MAG TPA: leucyl aminopeptidase [Bacteroidetes bacterium]|nr:leucyl aminopeptidase [Bacteroidota bacterium]